MGRIKHGCYGKQTGADRAERDDTLLVRTEQIAVESYLGLLSDQTADHWVIPSVGRGYLPNTPPISSPTSPASAGLSKTEPS